MLTRSMLTRSYLDRLTAPGAFLWAAGIERTFTTDSCHGLLAQDDAHAG